MTAQMYISFIFFNNVYFK